MRPGCFITNLLSEKNGIAANEVKLYGDTFEQDNITPSDVGRVIGSILVYVHITDRRRCIFTAPKFYRYMTASLK